MHKLNKVSQELMKTVTKYYKYVFLGLVLLAVSGCTTTGPKQIYIYGRQWISFALPLNKKVVDPLWNNLNKEKVRLWYGKLKLSVK
jgi:hypothetical protein